MRQTQAGVPYVVDEEEGAERLLVFFPKLAVDGAPPKKRPDYLDDVVAHQLRLGADINFFVGPNREMRGARAAQALIEDTRKTLGLERESVVAVGTSMGAVCSLWMGLGAGAGHVIVGSPPLFLGKTLKQFARVDGPTHSAKAGAPELLRLARQKGSDETAAAFLDRLIPRMVEAAPPARVDVLSGPGDQLFPQCEALAKLFEQHPQHEFTLHVQDYGRHSGIREAFPPFLRQMLDAPTEPPD